MKRLSPENLLTAQTNSFELISIAQPIMEDLHQFVEGSDTAILLTNNAGYVLLVHGDERMTAMLAAVGLETGASLSENVAGTNAVALALIEKIPSVVSGADHFLEQFQVFSGAGAPVFELSGHPLGVLGAFTLAENFHPHTLGLVTAGARAIEAQRQSDRLLEQQNEQLAELNAILEAITDGIIVWNADRTLVHANNAAVSILEVPLPSIAGRPLQSILPLPEVIIDAAAEGKPLTGIEVHLNKGDKVIECVASLRYVRTGQQIKWVVLSLRRSEEIRQLLQQQTGVQISVSIDDFVGESQPVRQLRRTASKIAPTRSSVLIRGEPGTGKDYLARAMHNTSRYRNKPFVVFNCASVPSELMLAELIGFDENMSRTGGRPSQFELANKGTLFVQNIEALTLETQAVLLNALELRIIQRLGSTRPIEIDVRIIASTDANLEKLVAQGSFRPDLFYRLSPFEIRLPPLRERRGDIPYILSRVLPRLGRPSQPPVKLAPGLLEALQRYLWPGNVRELEAVIERASLSADDGLITVMHLPEYIRNPVKTQLPGFDTIQIPTFDEMEREAIIKAARACHGNVTQMAQLLGIGRTTLWRRLKALNISPTQFRQRASVRNVS
ncbi:MAG TPA: sigma 54-interacting transcriptional regulator [Anaerolineales bacterium]|nr:sigma 54-interacting transcriptional regulator [Anaerolineales bacterium]